MASPQERVKLVLTPIWTREMGERLALVRMRFLRTQAELAALLSTPGHPVHQSQVRLAERGLLKHLNVSYARLQAVFPKDIGFILIGSSAALYNRSFILSRYWEHRNKTLRRRLGYDPKRAASDNKAYDK